MTLPAVVTNGVVRTAAASAESITPASAQPIVAEIDELEQRHAVLAVGYDFETGPESPIPGQQALPGQPAPPPGVSLH